MPVQTVEFSRGQTIALAIPMVAFSILSIVGNLLVIVTIVQTRALRTVTSVFLVNLALCDLVLGVTVMPLVAYCVIHQVTQIHKVSKNIPHSILR